MQRPEIIVTVGADGAATVEVNGCTGPTCRDLTRVLEAAMGETVDDTAKPEFHQEASHGQYHGQQ